MKTILFGILFSIIIDCAHAQEFNSLYVTDSWDMSFNSFFSEDEKISGLINRRNAAGAFNYTQWSSWLSPEMNSFSEIYSFDWVSKEKQTFKIYSDSDSIRLANSLVYESNSGLMYVSVITVSVNENKMHQIWTLDNDLNFIHRTTMPFIFSNEYVGLSSVMSNGNLLGIKGNVNTYVEVPIILDRNANLIAISDSIKTNFLTYQGIEELSANKILFSKNEFYDILILDSSLNILSVIETENIPHDIQNTIGKAKSGNSFYTSEVINYYDNDLDDFARYDLIYKFTLDGVLTEQISYSNPNPSLSIIASTEGTDLYYDDYLFHSSIIQWNSGCTIGFSDDCTSSIYVNSFDSLGNLRWNKLFGSDAYYQAAELVATPDSGVLVLAWRQDQLGGQEDIDVYASKLDKYGNVQMDFFDITSGINSIPGLSALVYPNPTSDYLYIQSGRPSQNAQLKIFGVSGRTVLCEEIDMTAKIDLRELVSGAYTFILEDDLGELSNGKFVKE